MEVTFDSRPCVRASVFLPRIGAWTADVESDDPAVPASPALLVLDGALTLRGSVVRSGVEADRWRGRIVGGAGGLHRDLSPAALRDTTLASVLSEVALAAGETLASGVAPQGVAARWHRVAAPAAHAVADVARAAGLAWRVLADGTLWMGAETWPPHRPLDVDLVDWRPELGRLELAGSTLGILPGQTLTVREITLRVGAVEHHAAREGLRTVVLAELDVRPAGRMLDALSRLVASLTRRVDYLAHYPARAVQQRADGTLDLVPDDPRVPSCQAVPIRYGVPGLRAEVPAGARVTLTYEGGDPSRPVATLWDTTTVTTLKVNGSTVRAAREGDDVTASEDFTSWLTTVGTATGAGAPPSVLGAISEGSDVMRIP